jgi:DNA-binding response OmpR family regulator
MAKILIADDDQGILDALTFILEHKGYQVESTADGGSLYDMNGDTPDLLLLDIRMSGHDGRDICKFLKSKKITKKVPIIMISANRDTAKHAKEAGADDYLPKPFEMTDLLQKVGKFVN